MRRALPALAAIALMLGVWGIALAAPDCTVSACTYVPISLSGPPTATPLPPTPTPGTTVPFPPCDQNAPPLAVGAQAWMTVQNPARFSMTTLCVRLIEDVHVVPGALMSATAHYKTKDTTLGTATAGADGVAHITFSIGGATSGYTVVVDGTMGGHSFATSFTPQ